MEVIKELCAFLPKINPRGVWGQFGIREYLSVTNWTIVERSLNADTGYCDFILEHVKPGFPGRFQFRTDWDANKMVGIYWAPEPTEDPILRAKAALLFDLTFTPNMVGHLGRPSMTHYPDAGSW